ncbi:MAG: HAMP domain-containing sensor histidine kinase [Bdellovibrionia bacterium]
MQQTLVVICIYLGFINVFNAISSGILWWRQKNSVFRDLFFYWCFAVVTFAIEGFAVAQSEFVKVLALNLIIPSIMLLAPLFISILGLQFNKKHFFTASILIFLLSSALTTYLYFEVGLRGFFLNLQPCISIAAHNFLLCGLAIRHVVLKRGRFSLMGWLFLGTIAGLGLDVLGVAFFMTRPELEVLGPALGSGLAYALSIFGFASAVEVLEKEKTKAKIEALNIEKEAAEKLNQTKSLFLTNISHELRTPMHGILSYARFGQQKIDAPKEKLKSFFDEIHDSGNRLMSLLNDLLDLAKLEAGKMEIRPGAEDLFKTAQAAVEEMSVYALERGIAIEVLKKSSSTETVYDEERIRQVLRNLISNALKFTKDKRLVRVEISVSNTVSKGQVINWGVGIPEKELETVFDKFVQSSKTASGAGGTGLGLAICREIIQSHGGRIWAENKDQGGTVFSFEFPNREILTKR